MIVKVTGISAPAPIPCSARNTISCSMLCESPDSSDPAKNNKDPIINTGFLPYKSLIFPKIGVDTAIVSKYAVNTQLSKATPPKSPTIRGPAGPITVPSIAARKVERSKPARM
ncbi:hypothetical protein D3C77_324390 [compost metagenome]